MPCATQNQNTAKPTAASAPTDANGSSPAATTEYPTPAGSAPDAAEGYISPRQRMLHSNRSAALIAAELHSQLSWLCSHPRAVPGPGQTQALCALAARMKAAANDLLQASADLLEESYFGQNK